MHSMGVQGMFPLTHWCSCTLNGCSGGVQYSLKSILVHSQAFRECSVLTQMRSFSWSHHGESHSIITQRQSYTLNGCSGGVQYSLIGIHMHLQVFRQCSMCVQPIMYLKAQCICFQICKARKGPINLLPISIKCHFFGLVKQEDMTSHLNT